jgi:uncharacterized protein involved in outer membrane biogenesis
MKKTRAWGVIALTLLLASGIALYRAGSGIDSLVRSGVEKFGPRVLGVPVTLRGIHLWPWSGSGRIDGLEIGNPPGFVEPYLARVEEIGLTVDLRTLTSPVVHIRRLRVRQADVHWEGGMRENNLTRIEAMTEQGADEQKKTAAPRRFVIDELRLEGTRATVRYAGMGAVTLPLPDIVLTDVGAQSGGATGAEIAQAIFTRIQAGIVQGIKLSPQLLGGAAKALGGGIKEIGKGIRSLFGK